MAPRGALTSIVPVRHRRRYLVLAGTLTVVIGIAVTVTLVIRRQKTVQVPPVICMSAPQAEAVLVAAGLTSSQTPFKESQKPGMVTSHSPAVGTWVPPKTKVHLTFGSPPIP